MSDNGISRIARRAALPDGPLRIVGGDKTLRFTSVACLGGQNYCCTGTLIHEWVILTAAHCAVGKLTRAMIGGCDIDREDEKGVELLKIGDVEVHPGYPDGQRGTDVALAFLAVASKFSPVPLASREQVISAKRVTLVGFGYAHVDKEEGFGQKRELTLDIEHIQRPEGPSLDEDAARLGFDPATEMVAGRKFLGKDTCNGDSGGPALIEIPSGHALAGVTSRATNEYLNTRRACGDGGIYVRADVRRAWIEERLAARGYTLS